MRSTIKCVKDMICLHFADLKMLNQKIVYIDIVKVVMTDNFLTISPQISCEFQSSDILLDSLWIQAAIDSEVGLLGY